MGKTALFILRSDAAQKTGGDLVQAEFYKKILETNIGFEVFFSHKLRQNEIQTRQWDLVHIFNISRIQENIATLANASYKKIILSPILQPGVAFGWKLSIKNYIRNLFNGRISIKYFAKLPPHYLRRFDGFVFLSERERQAFLETFPFCVNAQQSIYQNGVIPGLSATDTERVFDYITVSRIEPKKRVNELIDTVSAAAPDSLLVCVGGLNWYHPFYCLKFLVRVSKGKVLYLGKRPAPIVYAFMKRTKTLLNFSEIEVSPLVDLEALACGCNVISTKYSYAHLEECDRYRRIDVKDDWQCAQAVRESLHSPRPSSLEIGTWEGNSADYENLVNNLLC